MITLGIAAYNEENLVLKSLSLWLKEPVDEILVVSDSNDKTNSIIKKIKDKRIKLIERKERLGKASAINLILKKAKGSIIIMTDADLFVKNGSTKELKKSFKNNVGLVAGRPVLKETYSMLSYWSKISFDLIHKKRTENIGFDVTGNLYAVKKDIVKEIPNNAILDDSYVACNTIQAGYSIAYQPNAVVYVNPPLSLKDFINQKVRTRTGWYQLKSSTELNTNRSLSSGFFNYFPQTLKNLFTYEGIFYLPPFYLVSAFVWLKAWYSWKTKKYTNIWKIAETTKSI